MSGVGARSGGKNRITPEAHRLRGTLRGDRHRAPVAEAIAPLALPSMPPKLPAAPRHLRPRTRKWFRFVVERWEVEAQDLPLLTIACETLDRYHQAREAIDRDGLTVPSARGGPRIHPAVKVEAEARRAFARLLQQLNLNEADPLAGFRPWPARERRA